MTYHIPICPVCQIHEVGTFYGSSVFCSAECEDKNLDEIVGQNYRPSNDEYYEKQYDLFIRENE
jgi:hypothetical protein